MLIQKLPTISILTLTLNPNLTIFKKSLESIKNQDYPQNKIEHIIIDGGSRRDTINLAKKYGCLTLIKKEYRENSEARRSFGVIAAKNDIILWLEADNLLPDKNCLKELVKPFLDDAKIISTFTLHFNYNRNMNILDRYCALFGVSDPVVIYLNRAEKEPWFKTDYSKGEVVKKTKNYDVVKFDKNTLPTVGDNGSAIRRNILLKAKITPNSYFHTDVFVDLLNLGYNKFAVVKSTSIENYVGNSLLKLVKRRSYYLQRDAAPKSLKKRRYAIVNPSSVQDILRLSQFIIFSLTFIQPFYLSLKGFSRKKDFAWFFHPLACFLFLVYYTKTVMTLTLAKLYEKNYKK